MMNAGNYLSPQTLVELQHVGEMKPTRLCRLPLRLKVGAAGVKSFQMQPRAAAVEYFGNRSFY